MKVFARILFALTLWGLVSCGGTKSAQQVMAEDRAYMYKEAYKAYIDAENPYRLGLRVVMVDKENSPAKTLIEAFFKEMRKQL